MLSEKQQLRLRKSKYFKKMKFNFRKFVKKLVKDFYNNAKTFKLVMVGT